MPTIGFDEVRRHNGPKSCWMVLFNDVYDVTKFLESHPGGASSLLDFAGKDGTMAFESVGHSDDARSMMRKYKVGTLPSTEHSSHYKYCKKKPDPVVPREGDTGDIITDHRVEYVVYNVDTGGSSRLPKARSDEKPWRTFDGTPDRPPKSPKSGYSTPKASTPRIEPRVKTVVVPRERRPRGFPCEGGRSRPRPASSNGWKYALLALGAAVIIGIALKKYMAK